MSAAIGALLVIVALGPGSARAAPARPGDQTEQVILPGNEDAARELLADLDAAALGEFEWRGPSIEIDEIRFGLVRDGEAVGALLLIPRARGSAPAGAATSESFAIVREWPGPGQASARARALMDAAVASVEAHDHGGFYVERQARPSADRAPITAEDRAAVRRRWAVELGAVGILVLAALGLSLRRPPLEAERSA